ncbi:MAG: protein kinase, partial [Deltaproteobacteria bacterium]|nr:protein kinase [Deltaproteobacteria bacterium]
MEALRALHYLHTSRIYHFDIKAENVLAVGSRSRHIKLIDFGLAGIDPRGRLIGTPSYMAPEIVSHEAADQRADLYSLGVLWYYCLTRENPFRGNNTEETLRNQLRLVPPQPSTINPQVPVWMDNIIVCMLEKNPAHRFGSAVRVIREIIQASGQRMPLETRETLLSYLPEEGRLIGRAEPMAGLLAAIRTVKSPEVPHDAELGWFIVGGIGTGKTRLLKELKYAAQLEELRVVSARGSVATEISEWCDRCERHLAHPDGPTLFLCDELEALRNEALGQRLATLVARARRAAMAARCCLVTATRETISAEMRETLQAALPRQITLANFSREELRDYVITLTGLEEPPPQFMEGLYRRTQGNPLFVTEVVRGLILGGGLFDEHGRWQATYFEDVGVDFSKVVVPRTLDELLLERVAALGSEPCRMLEALATVGRPATATELGQWTDIADPFAAVTTLLREDILIRTAAATYDFKNALMGQLLDARLTRAARAQYHDRIAATAATDGTDLEVLLHHVSHGSDAKRAIAAAAELGSRYLSQGLGKRAAHYLERAVGLIVPEDAAQRVEVMMKLGEAYLIARAYDAAERQFAAVEQALTTVPISDQVRQWRAEIFIRLGGIFLKLQAFERAKGAFQSAEEVLSGGPPDPVRLLQIANFRAAVLLQEGRADEARRIFSETRAAQRALPAAEIGRVTNNDLGLALLALNDTEQAEGVFREDLASATELQDDLLIARAHYNLAEALGSAARYPEATAAYTSCISVCKRSENPELLLRAYNALGNLRLLAGDAEGSCRYYERGLALHERVGDLRGGAAIAVNLGIAEHVRQQATAALDHLLQAIAYLQGLREKSATDWTALVRGLLETGEILRERGDAAGARSRITEALQYVENVAGLVGYRFWGVLGFAYLALDTKAWDEFAGCRTELAALAESDAMRQQLETLDRLRADEARLPATHGTALAAGPLPGAASGSQSERIWSISGTGWVREQFYRHILEINKLLNAQRDLPFVLRTVLHYALELTHAESGAILLVDAHGELQIACQHNLGDREEELKLSRSLAGQVLAGGRWVLTNDAQGDARFAGEQSVLAYQLKSLLALPIRAKET